MVAYAHCIRLNTLLLNVFVLDMGIKIESASVSTLTLLYKDRTILAFAIVFAVILGAISVYRIAASFNAESAFLNSEFMLGLSFSSFISAFANMLVIQVILGIIAWLVGTFFLAAIISRAYYGDKLDVKGVIRNALDRYVYALGTSFLTGLILVVPFIISGLIAIVVLPLGIVLLLLSIIFLIYAAIMLSIAQAFAVVARKGPIDSLRLSWAAIRGNWWQVFLIFIIVGIAYYVVSFIISIPSLIVSFSTIFSAAFRQGLYNNSASAANFTSNYMTSITGVYESPLEVITVIITGIFASWFLIIPSVLYKQLVDDRQAAKGKK